MDYNPRAQESLEFFKMVQNKIHYAAHGHTAPEIIAGRANAELPFMGLTSHRYGKGVLLNAGTISHKDALEKAEREYDFCNQEQK